MTILNFQSFWHQSRAAKLWEMGAGAVYAKYFKFFMSETEKHDHCVKRHEFLQVFGLLFLALQPPVEGGLFFFFFFSF